MNGAKIFALSAAIAATAGPSQTWAEQTPDGGGRPEEASRAQPQEAKTEQAWALGQARWSPLTWSAGVRGPTLEQSFLGQLRLEADDGPTAAQLSFPRIRSITQLGLLEDRLSLALQFNVSPSSIELLDYIVDFEVVPGFAVSLGQQKIPLTRHREASVAALTFVDWSAAARFFGGERQLGLFARQQLRRDRWLRPEWSLGLLSGTNARSAFETGPSTVFDRPLPNPSDLRDPGAPAELHPEVAGRLALAMGRDDFGSDSDQLGGPLRLHVGAGLAYDAAPELGRDFAFRVAPEMLAKWRHLSLSVQGYFGWFDVRRGEALGEAASGLNVQAAWRLLPYLELAARHARVRTNAAWRAEAERVGAEAPLVGFDETTGALSLYVFDHDLKLQTDFTWRQEREGSDSVLGRLQLQIGF